MQTLPLAPVGVTPVRVLTIAGSDSGGSAGIESELRTMALAGVHGCVALTAVTVQNSLGVSGVHPIPAATVAAQVRSVVTDIGVGATKTGVLLSAEIIDAVADVLVEVDAGPLVLDPVAASVHGQALLTDAALATMRERLFPLATLLTPNLDEVRLLTGIDVVDAATQAEAARALEASRRADAALEQAETLTRDLEQVRTAAANQASAAASALATAIAERDAEAVRVTDARAYAEARLTDQARYYDQALAVARTTGPSPAAAPARRDAAGNVVLDGQTAIDMPENRDDEQE